MNLIKELFIPVNCYLSRVFRRSTNSFFIQMPSNSFLVFALMVQKLISASRHGKSFALFVVECLMDDSQNGEIAPQAGPIRLEVVNKR